MSINIRDVPNYEELLEYVPRSQYTRNAITQNRRITKLNSEQALAGMNFQPNLEAVFRVAPSTSTLLNLAECYFSITGHMMRPVNVSEQAIPSLKCGALWLLKCINKIVLEIGGCAVHSITTPALLAKLYEELAVNYNDKEAGSLTEDGFCKGVDRSDFFGLSDGPNSPNQQHFINGVNTNGPFFTDAYYKGNYIYSGSYTSTLGTEASASGVTITTDATSGITTASYGLTRTQTYNDANVTNNKALARLPVSDFEHFAFEGIVDYQNPTIPNKDSFTPIDVTQANKAWSWMFKVNLKLKDIFPIEKLKPIFGQSVLVRIQFDSKGFTGILDSFGGSPIVWNWQQFYLNVYQYNINVEMINKLNQIYSKPVVEIIDAVDKQLQSIPSITENNEVQIFIPLQMQFETDYVAIYMPHNISNNANDGLLMGICGNNAANNYLGGIMNYKYWKNFTEHTPMDYRFMNMNRIQVECDGEILYQRTFNENPYPANMPMPLRNTPYLSLVNNLYNNGITTIPLNDYTNAYELYKECRCYWDVTEESAMPFNEWLYSGFAIIIPTSCFSRLTTGSQLTISINFGGGLTNTPAYGTMDNLPVGSKPIGINERISRVNATQLQTEVLKQICVVQKYKKALVYNGFNNCTIKTITQSFEQDIEVTESNDAKTAAN